MSCHGFAVWAARGQLRTTLQTLTLAPRPAWDHLKTTCAPRSRDCSGSSDLTALFGLVGGPAARNLPLPALADVRTVTWPVGW
jgi:hypothetical protein